MNTQIQEIKSNVKSLRPRIIITHKELVWKAKPSISKVIGDDFDRTTATILSNRMATNAILKANKFMYIAVNSDNKINTYRKY